MGGQADYFRPPYGALTDEEILYLADKGIRWSIGRLIHLIGTVTWR
ncbi:MAG: hypothetical protein R2865_04370 [Deinococcales bacterium]